MGIRVLLVDNHALVRESLASMLRSHTDIHLLDQTDGVPDELYPPPHVVVLDVNDPQRFKEATLDIARLAPEAVIVAIAIGASWDCICEILESGARGFVLKDKAYEELPNAIRIAAAGDAYISPDLQQPPSPLGLADALAEEGLPGEMVCRLVELRNPLIAWHQRRVAAVCSALCEELGLSSDAAETIRQAALMHDVGKLGVPAEILVKPSSLDATEMRLVRGHCENGYLLLSAGKVAAPIPEMVYQHHERCDGSGYPRGLPGSQILFGAKVIAVADAMEAMLSRRPYRSSLSLEAAIDEIESGAGIFYDEQVARACAALFRAEKFRLVTE